MQEHTEFDRNKAMKLTASRSQTSWFLKTAGAAGAHKHRMYVRIATLLPLVLFCLVVGLPAFAGQEKIAQDLQGADSDARVDIIVQFKQQPTEAHHQKVRDLGGELKRELHAIRGAHYSVPAQALKQLADDPDVAYISPNRAVHGTLDYTSDAVNATLARNTYLVDGSGIGIAVIDSGITVRPDFYGQGSHSRVLYSQDFTGLGTASDLYGHGTHVAGILGGSGRSSGCSLCTRRFTGMAPNVNLVDLRVLDQNGNGKDSEVIAAIDQAIALRYYYNIRVINLSLGRPVFESYLLDPLSQAVEAAWKAGIVVVAAAGNGGRDNSQGTQGYATITAPGNDPYAITVGAMKTMATFGRSDDQIASYSSKGPTLIDHIVKPDIVAPGNRVDSVLAPGSVLVRQHPSNVVTLGYYEVGGGSSASNYYYTLSGTSMATPVVSGAAALLLQYDPTLTPDQVKARLMKTAYKTFPFSTTAIDPASGASYTSYYDVFTVGAGYVDIAAALSNNDRATGSALSPTAVYNPATNTVHLVSGASVVWGTSVIWGTSVVWGTNVDVNAAAVLWGTGVCWGTSTTQGFSVVWGNSVIWGTNSPTEMENLSIAIDGEN